MLLFWHVIAAFFFVLGLLDFIFELKKAFTRNYGGLWLLAIIDEENEEYAEGILRKASDFADNIPVLVCCKNISPEASEICRKICTEEGFDEIEEEDF